jgi:aminodeoxyfutalosine synthase
LNFGVDDLDGPVVEDVGSHDVGTQDGGAQDGGIEDADRAGTATALRRSDLLDLIWDAGFRPVERDARWGTVRTYEPPTPLAERRAEPQQVWA